MLADAALAVKDLCLISGQQVYQFDNEGNRNQQDGSDQAAHDIHQPLDSQIQQLARSEGERADAQGLIYAEVLDILVFRLETDCGFHDDVEAHSVCIQLFQHTGFHFTGSDGNQDFFDILFQDMLYIILFAVGRDAAQAFHFHAILIAVDQMNTDDIVEFEVTGCDVPDGFFDIRCFADHKQRDLLCRFHDNLAG